MKKALALMSALVLSLSMGTPAFAKDPPKPTDMQTVTITKDYNLTNPETQSPAETFNFTIERTSVTDAAKGVTAQNMPIPTIGGVQYAVGEAGGANKSKEITVTLPVYTSVGIYTYTIKETPGTNGGVTYYDKDIRLVVTVINDGAGFLRIAAVHTEAVGEDKNDNFPNEYSAVKELQISKIVTGNLGDKSKYFKVTVTLTGETGKTYQELSVSGGTDTSNPTSITVGQAAVFYLKDGETINILNVPYGVSYKAEEDNYADDGYETTYADPDGEDDEDKKNGEGLVDSADEYVGITNNKGVAVDTGIRLDSIPYILLLAVVVSGLAFFAGRRRVS